MIRNNNNLKFRARELRKNMTNAERLLWSKVRRKQLSDRQFYRQCIIGNYIVDFFCPAIKLIVEIDGGQHYHGKGQLSDQKRDEFLIKLGLKVLRFSNLEVLKNIEVVLEKIYLELNPP